jgi:hypothetical protein
MAKTPDEISREMWKAIGGGDATPGFTPQPQDASTGVQIPMGGVADIAAIYDPTAEGTPKATLGDWLAGETEKNAYGPSSGLSYGTLEVAGAEIGDARVYGADMLQAAQDYFDLQSGGGTADTREGGAFPATSLKALGVDKTDGVSGHTLLSGVEGNDWDTSGTTNYGESKSAITKATVSNVLKNNRFTPTGDSPYIDNRDYSAGMYTTQNQFGRYDPNANKVTLGDVSRIGLGLILRQTGDSQDPKDGSQTKALVEGLLEQLAIKKVDTVNLQAGTIEGVSGRPAFSQTNQDPTGALIDQEGERTRGNGNNEPIEAKGRKSYGALNSWLEPFDGPLPTAMILLAAIAAIATLVAGVILGLLLDLIFLIFPPGDEPMGKAPKPMGASLGKPDYGDGNIGFRILQFMGIPTLYSGKGFTMAMLSGVVQFFIGHAFPRILGASAGYYIVVCRAAIRDIEQITRATENTNFKDLVGAIEGVFVVLEAFTTSTMFRFLCTMAKLGDVSLMSGGVWGKQPLSFAPTDILPEAMYPSLANLHMKSRTYTVPSQPETDYGQAMRLGNLPSRFIMTKQTLNFIGENTTVIGYPTARAGFVANSGPGTEENPDFGTKPGRMPKFRTVNEAEAFVGGKNKIAASEAQFIEESLEATMMPFYFKDLRTNEIIALQAYVEGISDSYSPKWNATRGFGRTDPVQVYESTERKIGLSFWIVAYDEQDHDEMFFIVNKLVAMVYPQWSRGTQRQTGDGSVKFIQPFSQVPTASPLVRMRLGDLFRSNYTPRGLKKQFGYGTPSFEMKVTDPDGTADKSYQEVQGVKDTNFALAESDYAIMQLAQAQPPEPFDLAQQAVLSNLDPTGMLSVTPSTGYPQGCTVTLSPGKYPFVESVGIDPTKPKSMFGFKRKLARYKSKSSLQCKVIGYLVLPVGAALTQGKGEDEGKSEAAGKTKTHPEKYKVRYVVEPTETAKAASGEEPIYDYEKYGGIMVPHDALTPKGWKEMVDSKFATAPTAMEAAAIAAGFAEPAPPPEYSTAEEAAAFFAKENNAVARSFNAGGGLGIAVAITQLDFDWSNGETITWGTDVGKKAPQMVKVTMGFAPIHDLPLGLDADGGLAAPAYNTGNIVQSMFGIDPWSTGAVAGAKRLWQEAWGKSPLNPDAVEDDSGPELPGD